MWDIDISLKGCEFSALAYSPKNEIISTLKSKGYLFQEIIEDESTDTLVFVAFNGVEIIVCSRGTQDIKNWLTDCDIELTHWNFPESKLRVHKGFKHAHDLVWERVRTTIEKYRVNKDIPIRFFGHSLGASLSTLGFVKWREMYGIGNELCYNFGQPRVGNGAFAAHIDDIAGKDTVFRHIHLDDPIPKIPYRMGKFKHNNYNEIYWDIKDNPVFNPYPFTKISSNFEGFITENEHFFRECGMEIIDKLTGHKINMKGEILIPLIGDHFVANYLSVIKKYKLIIP